MASFYTWESVTLAIAGYLPLGVLYIAAGIEPWFLESILLCLAFALPTAYLATMTILFNTIWKGELTPSGEDPSGIALGIAIALI